MRGFLSPRPRGPYRQHVRYGLGEVGRLEDGLRANAVGAGERRGLFEFGILDVGIGQWPLARIPPVDPLVDGGKDAPSRMKCGGPRIILVTDDGDVRRLAAQLGIGEEYAGQEPAQVEHGVRGQITPTVLGEPSVPIGAKVTVEPIGEACGFHLFLERLYRL